MVGNFRSLSLGLVALGLLSLNVSTAAFAVGCKSAAEGRMVHHSDSVRDDFLRFPAARVIREAFPEVIAPYHPSAELKFVPGSWVSQDVTVVWLLDALQFAKTWRETYVGEGNSERKSFMALNHFLIAHLAYVKHYTDENYPLMSGSVHRMLKNFGGRFRNLDRTFNRRIRYQKKFGDAYLGTLKGYEAELTALLELPNVQNFSFVMNHFAPKHGELSSAASDFHARLYSKIQNRLVDVLKDQTKFKNDFPQLSILAGNGTEKEQFGFLQFLIGNRKEFDALVEVDGKFYIIEVKNGRRSRKAIKEQILGLLEIRKLATGEDKVAPFEVGAVFASEISPTVTQYLTDLGVRLFWSPNYKPQ